MLEMNGRVPSLKDLRLQAAALRTAASIGLAVAPTATAYTALELGSHLNTPVAEAAGACNPNKKDYQYTVIVRRPPFYDIGGKAGSFDLGIDPWFEQAVTGGSVSAVDVITGKELDRKSYDLNIPTIPMFTPKDGQKQLAWAVLRWQGECDASKVLNTVSGGSREVAAKRIKIVTSQDVANQSFESVIPTESFQSIWTGRNASSAKNFLDEYNRNPALARDLSPQTLREIQEKARQEAVALVTPTVVPASSTPTPVLGTVNNPIHIEQPVRVQADLPWYAWLGGLVGLGSLVAIAAGVWRNGSGVNQIANNTGDVANATHNINGRLTDMQGVGEDMLNEQGEANRLRRRADRHARRTAAATNRLADTTRDGLNNVADAVDHLPH